MPWCNGKEWLLSSPLWLTIPPSPLSSPTFSQYLEKARAVEDCCGSKAADVPGTLLNMSTILSELGRHPAALSHAEQAAHLLRQDVQQGAQDQLSTKMSLLAVAHHNIAVEHEHCHNLQGALAAYAEGIYFASNASGPQGSMVQRLKESHAAGV